MAQGIDGHALIGSCRTAAVVGRDGFIDKLQPQVIPLVRFLPPSDHGYGLQPMQLNPRSLWMAWYNVI